MAEYIEREAAKRAIMSQYLSKANKTKYADVMDAVPAADVVPVVRCRECAYHEIADYGGGYTKNVCRLLNRQIQNDDYCSYALSALRMDGGGE